MTGDGIQTIAAAVTPAVMVSACGLIALGLDNQVTRMSLRARELAREYRAVEGDSARRELLRRQVAYLDRRHSMYARAVLLDYGALFAFVVTSLLYLAQGLVPVPHQLPLWTFGLGVAMLGGMAVQAIASMHLARSALTLEVRELLGDGAAPAHRPGPAAAHP
jgi:hypothetical protein